MGGGGGGVVVVGVVGVVGVHVREHGGGLGGWRVDFCKKMRNGF